MEIIDLLKQIQIALGSINGSIWQYNWDYCESDEFLEYSRVLDNISASINVLYTYVDKIITDKEEFDNE